MRDSNTSTTQTTPPGGLSLRELALQCLNRHKGKQDSIQDASSPPLKQETEQPKKAPVVPPTTYTGSNSTILPSWVRPYVHGEQLDDTKERLCASPQCGAVLMRQGQSDYSWSNKRYCCAGCRNGKPPIPASHTTDRIQ